MTPESHAIRNLELISMDPRTAAWIERDLLIKESRCPECYGQGVDKMDAFPSAVCADCGHMFDANKWNIHTPPKTDHHGDEED